MTPTASKGVKWQGGTRKQSCRGHDENDHEVFGNEVRCINTNGSPRCAMGDLTLPTVPEELPKCDFAVCREHALARSRTSHVETSIQVEVWSMVGEVSGK